jgi:hypothetical protein
MATDDDTNELDDTQARNGAASDDDSLLKGAAKVATLGAVVGAAFGAARAVTARQSQGDDEPSPETEADETPGPEDGASNRAEQDERVETDDAAEAPEADWDEDEDDADDTEPYEPGAESSHDARSEEGGRDGGAPEREVADDSADDDEPSHEPSRDGSAAVRVIRRAREQLAEVTGRTPEAVLGLEKRDDGWLVTVEVLELARIPNSTDVLAAYEAHLSSDGDLLEYTRKERYHRGRTGGEEA